MPFANVWGFTGISALLKQAGDVDSLFGSHRKILANVPVFGLSEAFGFVDRPLHRESIKDSPFPLKVHIE
ncbi:MAG: hypothetical protein ABI615_06935 [Chthoniobacterales bacterium]